jgi:hypothetical protein
VSLEAKLLVALVVVLGVALALGIPAVMAWENECEARGGTAQSQEVGTMNNGVSIVDAWCEGPDGERLNW